MAETPRDKLASIINDLLRLKAEIADGEGRLRDDVPPVGPEQIRSIIAARKRRADFFRKGMFRDPAWDMMLELMAAKLEGREVSVSRLCGASGVPSSTALRAITGLESEGMVRRSRHPTHERIIWVELTEDAADSMSAYLRSATGMVL